MKGSIPGSVVFITYISDLNKSSDILNFVHLTEDSAIYLKSNMNKVHLSDPCNVHLSDPCNVHLSDPCNVQLSDPCKLHLINLYKLTLR